MTIDYFKFKKSVKPLPVFFFSHGGPTFADKYDHFGSNEGAWTETKKVGTYIKEVLKPDFIIDISAHWISDKPNKIEVGITGEGEKDYFKNNVISKKLKENKDENSLIYDFYNFPKKFYDTQFHSINNKVIAEDIVKTLNDSGILHGKTTERGLDHGVFVPLKVAFTNTEILDSNELDIDVPLIQVSLAGTSDIETHYRLGQILSKYRDQNGVIIFSGMSVHNLNDRNIRRENNAPLDYVEPFNSILTNILTNSNKQAVLKELKELPTKPEWKKLYYQSHPTNEHFLPVIIAAGASRGDTCKVLYTGASGSLGWNIYKWGD